MIKLMHISGSNLKVLEASLEKAQNSITIISVNYVGTNWYVHFLVQDVYSDNLNKAPDLSALLPKPKKGK